MVGDGGNGKERCYGGQWAVVAAFFSAEFELKSEKRNLPHFILHSFFIRPNINIKMSVMHSFLANQTSS